MNGLEVTRVFFKDYSKGSMRAWADVQFNGVLMVRGFKVFEGSNGLFVKEPSEKKDVAGEAKYFPSIGFPKDWYARDAVNPIFDAVLDEYRTFTGKGAPSASKSTAPKNSNSDVAQDDMPF